MPTTRRRRARHRRAEPLSDAMVELLLFGESQIDEFLEFFVLQDYGGLDGLCALWTAHEDVLRDEWTRRGRSGEPWGASLRPVGRTDSSPSLPPPLSKREM